MNVSMRFEGKSKSLLLLNAYAPKEKIMTLNEEIETLNRRIAAGFLNDDLLEEKIKLGIRRAYLLETKIKKMDFTKVSNETIDTLLSQGTALFNIAAFALKRAKLNQRNAYLKFKNGRHSKPNKDTQRRLIRIFIEYKKKDLDHRAMLSQYLNDD